VRAPSRKILKLFRRKVALLLSALLMAAPIAPAQADEDSFTVMSRNIYLGADVGVALELIPNLPAAAQFMWEQVQQTNFAERKAILAKEIMDESPDVIGLQEATIWYCKAKPWSTKTEVYNFTTELLAALGGTYVIAEKDGEQAFNPGYSIGPIPFLTKVNDAKTFQPLFGQNSASCGFQIGDALLIKKELRQYVNQVGNSEYEAVYKVVPTIMEIYRGYTWADITMQGSNVRFVSTHLESLWDSNKVPKAADQARQLVSDLTNTKSPIVVIGDFNSDPRDPRAKGFANPGAQPEASDKCPTESPLCNAYKVMREANFTDAGPDASDPATFTWGMNALLTGADTARKVAAKEMGNQFGFTDRLDYIFVKNGIDVLTSKIIGQAPPYGSDHAGVVSQLRVTAEGSVVSDALDAHSPLPISFWEGVGLLLLALIIWRIVRRIRRR
jgi:endonuclease/exonuclease/phosphatase family metal-dependent hydrolase